MARAKFSIGHVAERSGVPATTLRFYEDRGVLPPAERVAGRRVYGPEVFEQLALTDLLRKAGFSLAEVAAAVNRKPSAVVDLRQQAQLKLREVERQVEELRLAAKILGHIVACRMEPIESCAKYKRPIATHAHALASNSSRGSLPGSAAGAGLAD